MRVLGVGPSCGPACGGTQVTLYVELLPNELAEGLERIWISFAALNYKTGEILEERFAEATFVYENELTCTAPAFSAPRFVEVRVARIKDGVPSDLCSVERRAETAVSR